MIKLLADETPLSVLRHAVETVEIVNEEGTLIGRFLPVDADQGRNLYDKAEALLRAKAASPATASRDDCLTTDAILDHLQASRERTPVPFPR